MRLVPALSLGIVAITLLLVSSIWTTARREGRGIGREKIADDEISRSKVVETTRQVEKRSRHAPRSKGGGVISGFSTSFTSLSTISSKTKKARKTEEIPLKDFSDTPSIMLGLCEGDCDTDSHCKDGLKCSHRGDLSAIPGCSGVGKSNYDYCAYPPLKDFGASPNTSLGLCEGDCDNDSQCKDGLKCFQRDGLDTIPGCHGVGKKDYDYCTTEYNPRLWDYGPTPIVILGICEGDCDIDSHCKVGLKCFQRSGHTAVPGCNGVGKKDYDYCIRAEQGCPPLDFMPATSGTPGVIAYDKQRLTNHMNGIYPANTKATFTCPYNSLRYHSDVTSCETSTRWDKDPIDQCENNVEDKGFRLLPQSFDMCPSFMFLDKEECRLAGLAVGGYLLDGNVLEGSWSWVPFGCSIHISGGRIHYNSFHGKNNGNYQPICNKGKFTLLPESFKGGCPASMDVSREGCAAAGLSIGGKLEENGGLDLKEGTWSHVPFGCSLRSDGGILYNSDSNGENDGNYGSLCHKLSFIKYYDSPKCPLESAISKDECIVAGLSVGGRLQNNELTEGAWDDKPSGCFLLKGNNFVHFNNNPIGTRGGDYISVCHEIEAEDVIVVPPDSWCPTSLEVSRDDCEAAGLDAGGVLQNGTVVEGSWGNRPRGCFFGPVIYYNSIVSIPRATHQANEAIFDSGASIDTDNSGFTGPGYINMGGNGSWVQWSIDGGSGGLCELNFRYAVSLQSEHKPRKCEIKVNGEVTGTLNFLSTGPSWSNYGYDTIVVTCQPGMNNIRLTAITSNGGPNVDNLQVSPQRVSDERWHSICNKMKGVVKVPAKHQKCPTNKEVNKEDCIAAGLTVGGDLRGGTGSWNDRPSGCFMEEAGNNFIYYNRMANHLSNYFFIPFMDSGGNDIGKYSGGLNAYINTCDANDSCSGFNSNGWLKHTIKDESQWTKWTDNPNLGFYVKKQESGSKENVSLLCQWECPQSNSIQHPGSFGCQCVDGYVSQETGQQVLEGDTDMCISALLSSFIHVTPRSIAFRSKVVTEMSHKVLTQRAPANDIVINLTERFSKKSSAADDGSVEYQYVFSGLEPGHRYNAHFSYIDINGDDKNMTFPAVTSCSCTSDADKTGPPRNLNTIQDNGHVMFSFEDDSLCEEAYSFTRTNHDDSTDNKAVSFTRDYYFIPMQACGSVIQPLTEASDNLAKSKLIVGRYYEYCVRAVHQILYMDHPFDYEGEGRTLLSSSDTCTDHKIKWEASIHGKITTGPNAGLLPIKDVNVAYELLNEDLSSIAGCSECSGSTTTKQGGTFDLVFNLDNDVFEEKNGVEFPIKVTFSKSTNGIEHQFLCNEGEDDCSGSVGTIVYLSHLQFREPLHVYDDTSVPFSGKVSIVDTAYAGVREGCAIASAEVCLIHERNVGGVMKTNETLVCGITDPDGRYSVPVIIGSRVDYVDIMYHNHTFDLSLYSEFESGTVIEAEKYYLGMDFVDTAKARLMVDVVGGLCNKNLGTSTVHVKIVGCDWEGMEMTQSTTRGIYNNVPAHLVDVQVVNITDSTTKEQHDHIWDHFQGERPLVRTIDLRFTGAADASIEEEKESLSGNSTTGITSKDNIKQEEESNLDAMAKEEEEDLELVRFQYDGELQMEVSVFPDSLRCSKDFPGDSYHVLEYMTYFLVRVDLKYELIKGIAYCDILDSELKLRVENKVGVDENEGFEDFYNSISDDQTKEALIKCNETCLYDIGHQVDEDGNLSSANVTEYFAAGRPNIAVNTNEPEKSYTKMMTFTIQGGTGEISHKAFFLVEGYYSKGPGRSFALPTHKPIMILRDPPGGMSYATYENVVTTMKLETSSTIESDYNKFGFDFKLVVDAESDLCTGGGLGAIVLGCTTAADFDNKSRLIGFDENKGNVTQMSDKTRSNQFSTKWSYKTSSDPWTAGAMSDVFVVPNLNIMYREVYAVEWDNATCAVKTEDDGKLPATTTFNIEDTKNEPALAFFSRYHVEYVKIPELRRATQNKMTQNSTCGCTANDPNTSCAYTEADGTEKTITCLEIANEIASLQAGIDGWATALQEEKDTFDLNSNDATKSINNWFTQYGTEGMHSEESVHIRDHNSGLGPLSLTDNKESLDNGLSRAEDDDKPVKRIQFSGGGNLFSMTLNKQKMWNEVGLSCWDGCYRESDTSIKGPGLDEVTFKMFGNGLQTQFLPINVGVHILHESTAGETDIQDTSIGFVLGDEDPQDEFVVDLFYDDKFGTVIFKTVGGQSKCPHETNTAAIEDPRLVITRRPSQHVFPEEDMIFELEITNLGVGDETQFSLVTQHRDNSDGLQMILDGQSFVGTEITSFQRDTTYKKTLIVRRGPLKYKYTPLEFGVESACEDSNSLINDLTASAFKETKAVAEGIWNFQEEDGTKVIKFVEPCPKVEWAGELKRDRHFVVNTKSTDQENLKVTIFNPNHGQDKFFNLTSDRLQNVFLYYRELGDLHWSKARTEITNNDGSADSLTLDFAAEYAYKEESDYGYSSLDWALANKVPEGTYEIRVDAECDQLGGPADMDLFSTPILSGVIDLTRPEQYGRALPLRDSLLVGEEIVVAFTEPVRCEAFDLLVTIDDLGVELDRNDPPIQIVCDSRKIGFQIDPTQINVEDWIGMSFSVEMGKINTANVESKSNIFDMNGNEIARNVKFEKTFADIDLDKTSTSFTVTLNNMNYCSDASNQMCSDEIKEKIVSLLILNSTDENRIEVESVSTMSGGETVIARIKIKPVGNGRMLRKGESSTTKHSVSLFRDLQSVVEGEEHRDRMLVATGPETWNIDNSIVGISDMKILPYEADMELLTTDPEMLEEEEELYRYVSMKGDVEVKQLDLNKLERQSMIDEIENNSKSREETMMNEMKEESKSREEAMMNELKNMSSLFRELKESKEKSQSELKLLRFELAAVTLACIGISLVAYMSLKRS